MIVNEVEYKNWSEILNKCLKDLKTKYPEESESALAESIGLSRATFNRIKNEKKLPRLDNIIKIIIGSGNIDFLSKALSFHSSDLSDSIGKILEVALKEKQKITPEVEIQKKLRDPDYFIVYILCSMSQGASSDSIKEIIGSKAEDIIRDFLSNEVIFFHAQKYHLKSTGVTIRDFQGFKHHLPTFSKYYSPLHVGKNRNYCHSLTEGLNECGVSEIRNAHKLFHQKCQEILRNPRNHGEIPFFSVSFCDSLSSLANNGDI